MNQLAGLVPEIVVAHIDLDLVVVDVADVGADVVEEVPVVAHYDHRAGVVHQKPFQPVDAGHVQVVGGFVQQDDVRLPEESLGQKHLHLFLGRQGAHGLAQQV